MNEAQRNHVMSFIYFLTIQTDWTFEMEINV